MIHVTIPKSVPTRADDIAFTAERLAGCFYSPSSAPDTAYIEDVCLAMDELLSGRATTARNDYLQDTTLASFIMDVMKKRALSDSQ